MGNYKIRVANEAESKEAQELFFELGFNLAWDKKKLGYEPNHIFAKDGVLTWLHNDLILFRNHESKEITLPQLRDLVVLKRNDVRDENVIDPYYNTSLYLDSKGDLFVFHIPTKTWKESNLNGDDQTMRRLKPIGSVMKEYLDPANDYKFIVTDKPFFDWIEIPYGAEVAYFFSGSDLKSKENDICFYKDDIGSIYYDDDWHNIGDEKVKNFVLSKGGLLWKRKAQPEELPINGFEGVDAFIESNVEQGVKHSHYKKDVSHLDILDIYRVTELFKPHSCGAHIAKKALCSGQRGHKDLLTDIQDIIDTAERWKQMLIEDSK